jgi:hypothetical protein
VVQASMTIMTSAIKSYFLVIVALASVMGSALAAPHISNLVTMLVLVVVAVLVQSPLLLP